MTGSRRHHTGLAAEDAAARHYERQGGQVLARRLRTPEGEIDLVVEIAGLLVFVEVKARKRAIGFDSPVSDRQWRRLGNAALHYMMTCQQETGRVPSCRFDVVIMAPDGRLEVFENARSFDTP